MVMRMHARGFTAGKRGELGVPFPKVEAPMNIPDVVGKREKQNGQSGVCVGRWVLPHPVHQSPRVTSALSL